MSRCILKCVVLGCSVLAGRGVVAQQASPLDFPSLIAASPVPGSQRTPSDFNGDGLSDIAWTNPGAGQFAYWLMGKGADGKLQRSGSAVFNLGAGDYVAAVGDVNGDGFADIVVSDAKRDLNLWLNDRSGHFTSTYFGTYPGGWQLIGAGDVDGDGQDDLLWADSGSCQIGVWYMKEGKRVGLKAQQIACGYGVVGLGYFGPSNRISMVLTSAINDVQILDSQPAGFVASDVTPSVSGAILIGIGGGSAGQNIVAEYRNPFVDGDYQTFGSYQSLIRAFDASGAQTGFSWSTTWNGVANLPWGVGGAVVQGVAPAAASLIQSYGNGLFEACAPGVSAVPYSGDCAQFTYPRGWFVVGAPANGAGQFGKDMTL